MKKNIHSTTDGYDPARLLKALQRILRLRSDTALARVLEVPVVLLQQVRVGTIPVTPELLIRMEEVSGWSGRQLRDLMGDRRLKFRFDDVRDTAIGDLISDIYALDALKKGW